MLRVLHLAIIAVYWIAPAAAMGWAMYRHRRGHNGALGSLAVTTICGVAVGMSLVMIYATGTAGRATIAQIALASYFATAMLLLLRGFDWSVQAGLRRALRLDAVDGWRRALRVLAFALVRVCVLFGIGLPYVMAAVMVYRPRVMPADDPRTQLGFKYERVEFRSADGTRLVGWWIPAQYPPRRAQRDAAWGTRTVLVCHGLAASKSNQLILARALPPGGFNVLAFDFRAHGESGGQLATFGDHERRDVLGAVKWLRQNHPEQSQQIAGVGASMGAVALIGAAADDSPEGRAIASVAAYAGYDRLDALTKDLCDNYFAPPLDWLLLHVAVPIASAHTGTNLRHFAPADEVGRVWPRPVLLIHGERDEVIDFQRGGALLEAASQPKYHLWFPQGSHNDIVSNEAASRIVLEFFRRAEAVPVI